MRLSNLIYSKVYAQQDPAQADTLCTQKYWSLYTSIDNQWVCSCKDKDGSEKLCSQLSSDYVSSNKHNCTTPKYSEWIGNKCDCVNGFAKNADGTPKNECLVNKAGSVGIKCTAQDLINNTCSRNINKTLGIRSSDTTPNPTLLLQDVVLGATSFVGTIIMVALVYLGFKAVLQWADDSDALWDIKGKAKNLIIWFLLVIGSYTIIRLVQYIARGF